MIPAKKRTVLLACAAASIASAAGDSPAHLISAGRAVQIDLKGVSTDESARFKATYPVSEEGMIRLPNLSEPVRAAGLTASQLAILIENAYRSAQIYKDPKVLVIASSGDTVEKFTVTIGGQVKRPGPAEYNEGMTLYQALQAGGGATEFGSMRRVTLIREGKAQIFDLTKNENKNLAVKPNDTIEVPEKGPLGG